MISKEARIEIPAVGLTMALLALLAAVAGFFTVGLGAGIVMGLGAGYMQLSKPRHLLSALCLTVFIGFFTGYLFLPIKMAFAIGGAGTIIFAVMYLIARRGNPFRI